MSRRWYLAALVPLGLGIAIAVIAFTRLIAGIEAMPRMVVPGEHTFSLPAGDHVVYAESESHVDGVAYVNERFSVRCSLKADGEPVPLVDHGGKLRYSLGGYSGGAIFDFTLAKPASATLACELDEGKAVLAVGSSFGFMIVVAVVPLVLGFVGAVVAFVLVYRRRKRYLELVAARDRT